MPYVTNSPVLTKDQEKAIPTARAMRFLIPADIAAENAGAINAAVATSNITLLKHFIARGKMESIAHNTGFIREYAAIRFFANLRLLLETTDKHGNTLSHFPENLNVLLSKFKKWSPDLETMRISDTTPAVSQQTAADFHNNQMASLLRDVMSKDLKNLIMESPAQMMNDAQKLTLARKVIELIGTGDRYLEEIFSLRNQPFYHINTMKTTDSKIEFLMLLSPFGRYNAMMQPKDFFGIPKGRIAVGLSGLTPAQAIKLGTNMFANERFDVWARGDFSILACTDETLAEQALAGLEPADIARKLSVNRHAILNGTYKKPVTQALLKRLAPTGQTNAPISQTKTQPSNPAFVNTTSPQPTPVPMRHPGPFAKYLTHAPFPAGTVAAQDNRAKPKET